MSLLDESEIQHLLADPDQKQRAFSVLVNQYGKPLYWKIRSMVVTHEDADDVLQNTFLKAWRSLDDFRGGSKLGTWLYRIAVNESLDFLRREKTRTSGQPNAALSVADRLSSDPYFDGDRAQALLQEAVSTLPDVQRAVFTLRYFDNMKYKEMSQILQTTEGALKASYHFAVDKVKHYLETHQ